MSLSIGDQLVGYIPAHEGIAIQAISYEVVEGEKLRPTDGTEGLKAISDIEMDKEDVINSLIPLKMAEVKDAMDLLMASNSGPKKIFLIERLAKLESQLAYLKVMTKYNVIPTRQTYFSKG